MQITRLKGKWVVIHDGRIVGRFATRREAEIAKEKTEADEAASAAEHASWKEKNNAEYYRTRSA